MTTIIDLINFFDHNSREYQEFLKNLIYFNGDIPFDVEEVDRIHNVIISTINSHLNRLQSRYSGLLILDKILSQCSKEILSKYCLLWISKATQVLESIHSTPQELFISCKVLGQLIIQSKDISEIQKQVSMQNIKQLINVINNLSTEKRCGPIYYLIAVLLYQYPEVCERFQISLKKIILSQIDSYEENLINASAKCYALLAKVTERSFKPSASKLNYTSWTYNQALICNSLHTMMDELFSSLIELENIDIGDKLELPDISEENILQFYFTQEQRFSNLCSYLSYMLRGFDKKNSVFPREILKVLCRGLAIQPSNLKNQNTTKEQMIYLILPKLHIALFSVLDALINGFKEQLVPFGSTILQLFLQTLQWTENVLENQVTISGDKPFRNIRICVYKCLNSWLMITYTLSGIEIVANEYLPSILKDIVPEKDRVLLTIQKTQNLSKRALKRLRDNQYEKGTYLNNGIASNKEHGLDVDLCKVALDVLQNIFFNSGNLLKQTFFKTVQNIIVPLLYDCYLTSTDQKFYKENPNCRLLLFRVLRALQMNPHSLVPLPTQYSIELFELALNDNSLCIVQEAKVALVELEKIVHPHAPSIQLTQVETIEKEFVTNDQIIQENSEIIEHNKDVPAIQIETVADKDIEPSSNKKLKVTNSYCNETDESVVNSVTAENEINITHSNRTLLKEQVNMIQNVNTIESKQLTENYDKSTDESNSIQTTINTKITESVSSSSSSCVTKEIEGNCTENVHVTEENHRNVENASELNLLPSEVKEDEMLKLFHDIPKNND